LAANNAAAARMGMPEMRRRLFAINAILFYMPQKGTHAMTPTGIKVKIETISGRRCTVLWHNPREHIYRHFSQIDLDCYANPLFNGEIIYTSAIDGLHIATALPPLPRHPTKDDARLLCLYAAHGLMVHGFEKCKGGGMRYIQEIGEITHAVTESGERVEIAIREDA